MSLGVIPTIETPTYTELRNREDAGWYQDEMRNALAGKLNETNEEYGLLKKVGANIIGLADNSVRLVVQAIRRRKK